jgi:hypothetical protein
MGTVTTKRRKRRRAKAKLRHGSAAVRKHTKLGGRTGMIHAKRTPARNVRTLSRYPNPPSGIDSLGGYWP